MIILHKRQIAELIKAGCAFKSDLIISKNKTKQKKKQRERKQKQNRRNK